MAEIARELTEWALEELESAREMADSMAANDREEIVRAGKSLVMEIEEDILSLEKE